MKEHGVGQEACSVFLHKVQHSLNDTTGRQRTTRLSSSLASVLATLSLHAASLCHYGSVANFTFDWPVQNSEP